VANRGFFSRSGATSPLGKLDDRIEAFRIEGVVKARLTEMAARRGKPLPEYLRVVLQVITFGPDTVKRMHLNEVDEVVKMLEGKGGIGE
jgi:hypothetical protein